jgi:hypothetical protein
METAKENYEAPEILVLQVHGESMICASGELNSPDFSNGGELFF